LPIAVAAYGAVDGTATALAPEGIHKQPLKRRLSIKHEDTAVSNACAQCGYDDDSMASCCHPGGSWKGTCCDELEILGNGRKVCTEAPNKSGQHTFTEGYEICHGNQTLLDASAGARGKATHRNRKWWSMEKLSSLYENGKPSNHLAQTGLTLHCFDQTEDPQQMWKPCTAGYCSQFKDWWSGSIVNTKQHNTYGGSGIILSPAWTKLLCSHWADMGTMENGCNVSAANREMETTEEQKERRAQDSKAVQDQLEDERTERDKQKEDRERQAKERKRQREKELEAERLRRERRYGMAKNAPDQPFKPAQLKEMLEHSMNERGAPFNEVLIDSKYFLANLPESVAAIFYFHDASTYDKILATRAYVGMLDAYNLSESDFRLLKINHNAKPLLTEGTLMADDSMNARQFLKHHPFGKYRQNRDPVQAQIPEEARRWRLRQDRQNGEAQEEEMRRLLQQRKDVKRETPEESNEAKKMAGSNVNTNAKTKTLRARQQGQKEAQKKAKAEAERAANLQALEEARKQNFQKERSDIRKAQRILRKETDIVIADVRASLTKQHPAD